MVLRLLMDHPQDLLHVMETLILHHETIRISVSVCSNRRVLALVFCMADLLERFLGVHM
jgi:hypothetical protein